MERLPLQKNLPNSNQDLIDAIAALEQIKQRHAVRVQTNLLDGTKNLQALFAQSLVDSLSESPSGLNSQEMSYARANEKVKAMKSIRARKQNTTIIEAKEMVLRWQKENGINPYGGQQ